MPEYTKNPKLAHNHQRARAHIIKEDTIQPAEDRSHINKQVSTLEIPLKNRKLT